MTELEYKENSSRGRLPRLTRQEVDLIACGYEWTCPACGELNHEIAAPELAADGIHNGTVICSCGKRFRANTPEHAHE